MKKTYEKPEVIVTDRRRGILEDVIYEDGVPFFIIRSPLGEIATYPGTPAALAELAHGPAFDFPVPVDFELDHAGRRVVSISLIKFSELWRTGHETQP